MRKRKLKRQLRKKPNVEPQEKSNNDTSNANWNAKKPWAKQDNARLQQQREEEAEARRQQRAAEKAAAPTALRASKDETIAWRRPTPVSNNNSTPPTPTRGKAVATPPPRAESPSPAVAPSRFCRGGAGGGWRAREEAKSAAGPASGVPPRVVNAPAHVLARLLLQLMESKLKRAMRLCEAVGSGVLVEEGVLSYVSIFRIPPIYARCYEDL